MLCRSVAGSDDLLFDVAHLADTVGLSAFTTPSCGTWPSCHLPAALPLYADHACRLIAALRGKSQKCLVLDLDNTLWGGVIGDDGLRGYRARPR